MLSHFIIMLVLNEIHTANIIHGYSSELRFYNFVERKRQRMLPLVFLCLFLMMIPIDILCHSDCLRFSYINKRNFAL